MKKNKMSFVLWSGGLDSTYLVQKLLDENKEGTVRTGYVEIINNLDKTIAEKRARDEMIPIFTRKYGKRFKDDGVIHRAEICVHNHWSPLVQMPIWFNALIGSTPMDADEVCLGYVMNDCAISYLNELQTLFRCFSKNISKYPFPKVRFPLSKIIKEDISNEIDKELKKHVTWCEIPTIKKDINGVIEKIEPCGRCVPCKHSPILEYSKPLNCEREFVESFNKSDDKGMIGLKIDNDEASTGQDFFNFYHEYMKEEVLC